MSLKGVSNGLPQTFFPFKLEGHTFNIHADCQVCMLSDFPGEQPKTSKRSKRTRDQSEVRGNSLKICRVIFAKWHEHLCFRARIFLKTHYQLACTAYVGLKFSVNFDNVLYQTNLSMKLNFVPFILFYGLKLKHSYDELSRGGSWWITSSELL